MYVVYVLYSPSYNKIYIGFTANIEERLKSNNFLSKKGWTVKFRPWEIVYKESFDEKQPAMKREKQLKSAKGREFLHAKIEEFNKK
jgi:putative endonuclease